MNNGVRVSSARSSAMDACRELDVSRVVAATEVTIGTSSGANLSTRGLIGTVEVPVVATGDCGYDVIMTRVIM